MQMNLNRRALRWARRRIGSGNVTAAAWSPDDDRAFRNLPAPSPASNYFLADNGTGNDGAELLNYPFVSSGERGRLEVNRNALLAVRRAAGDEAEILGAVDELLSLMDDQAGRAGDDKGIRRAYVTPASDRDEYRDRTEASQKAGELVFRTPAFELRADEGDDGPILTGYAAVFDQLSESMWWGYEKIEKGAFAASLKRGDDVLANLEHEGGLNVIGRRSNDTLDLEEDDVGLRVVIRPPDTNTGQDVVKLVRGGFLTQMSFAFIVRKQELDETGDDLIRTLREVDLYDVAIVAFPAYPGTSIESNSRPEGLRRDVFDRRLRILEASAGLTRRRVTA